MFGYIQIIYDFFNYYQIIYDFFFYNYHIYDTYHIPVLENTQKKLSEAIIIISKTEIHYNTQNYRLLIFLKKYTIAFLNFIYTQIYDYLLIYKSYKGGVTIDMLEPFYNFCLKYNDIHREAIQIIVEKEERLDFLKGLYKVTAGYIVILILLRYIS